MKRAVLLALLLSACGPDTPAVSPATLCDAEELSAGALQGDIAEKACAKRGIAWDQCPERTVWLEKLKKELATCQPE